MMSQAAPRNDVRNKERIRKRLAAYSRYAAVVQAQFRALEEEDVSRFSELARDRQEIQDELGLEEEGAVKAGALDAEGRQLLSGAQKELETAALLDQEIRERLLSLRGELGAQIKSMGQREGSVKKYLIREEAPSEERPSRLNVRL